MPLRSRPLRPLRDSSLPTAAAGPLLGALLILTACAAPRDAGGTAVEELVIRAGDFAFEARRTTPAGLTRIVLRNDGPAFHHVQLVRLSEGHTVEDYVARLGARDFAPAWASFVGGPDAPGRRGESEATVLLTEGEYAVVCLISEADGVPHVMRGMHAALTVTAPRASVADTRMLLREYDFDIAPALTAGRHTIRVENGGTQPHHVAIVRLGAGRSAEDALAWMRTMQGDAPDEMVGGTTAIAAGQVNYVTVDLVPGDYALICFIPDATDGRSHAQHGMLRTVRVR